MQGIRENTAKILDASVGGGLLFVSINKALLEQLAGKPYQEQLKVLLNIVREVKKSEHATEEVIRAAEKGEWAISRELNMINAGLN